MFSFSFFLESIQKRRKTEMRWYTRLIATKQTMGWYCIAYDAACSILLVTGLILLFRFCPNTFRNKYILNCNHANGTQICCWILLGSKSSFQFGPKCIRFFNAIHSTCQTVFWKATHFLKNWKMIELTLFRAILSAFCLRVLFSNHSYIAPNMTEFSKAIKLPNENAYFMSVKNHVKQA